MCAFLFSEGTHEIYCYIAFITWCLLNVVSCNVAMTMMMMMMMMIMLQFHDSWKSLCEWLDAQEQKLRQLSTNTAKMKHDLEELQVALIMPRLSSRIICIILFLCSVRSRVCTARRRPTYSVKLRLWKVSTFYFKIVASPTPLTITITPRRQTRSGLIGSFSNATTVWPSRLWNRSLFSSFRTTWKWLHVHWTTFDSIR